MNMKVALGIVALAVVIGGVVIWRAQQQSATTQLSTGSPIVPVSPAARLTASAQIGKSLFETNCASCHGRNAAGQAGIAPPLIHKIYEPSHHGDESFQRAAAIGVRAHHWRFGDMPPVEGLDRAEISKIISYIRELQRTNGIF